MYNHEMFDLLCVGKMLVKDVQDANLKYNLLTNLLLCLIPLECVHNGYNHKIFHRNECIGRVIVNHAYRYHRHD